MSFKNLFTDELATWPYIILSALFLFFIIQSSFYIFLYRKPYRYAKKHSDENSNLKDYPSITVIVAAKNQAECLRDNLSLILQQDYPNFEVVFVNMGSTDDTDLIIRSLSTEYSNFYHTYVPVDAITSNEKELAVVLGAKAAKYDILLFTEPYCRPLSKDWLKQFAREFNNGKEVVLGYSRLSIDKSMSMRKLAQYENFIYSLRYLSKAIAHKPFMGMGSNMACTKELFFKNKKRVPILGSIGAEDSLLINRISDKQNTGIVLSDESMTENLSISKYSDWRRFIVKYQYSERYFKGFGTLFFVFETISSYMFYLVSLVGTVLGVIYEEYPLLLGSIALFIIQFFIKLMILNKNCKLLKVPMFHLNLLYYDILLPFKRVGG